MKIAVMTWFHYDNYGTVLQVTALYRKLSEQGHQVEIIQYYPRGKGDMLPSLSLFREIWDSAVRTIQNSKHPSIIEDVNGKQFDAYRSRELRFTEPCETLADLEALSERFDAFICGSDQIWSPLCFEPHYFLDFMADAERMVAYAPSIGVNSIEDPYIKKRMAELIGRFKHVSLRENSGAEIVGKLIGKDIPVVLDPTLLLSMEEWEKGLELEKQETEPYLLAYFLGVNERYWRAVYTLAERLKLEVKVIPVFRTDRKRRGIIDTGVGPGEFVKYIQNAAFVCTDSFHGVAFSVNFSRDFCCFERFGEKDKRNQNSRIYHILDILGLNSRLYRAEGEIDTGRIDYAQVHRKLEHFRKESQDFLWDSLAAVEQHCLSLGSGKKHVFQNGSLCCGCGACAQVCPVNAIQVRQAKTGFYRAVVREETCISCGKCQKICPFRTGDLRVSLEKKTLYSYKDPDPGFLRESSSGGIAGRLAILLQKKGYSVAGCIFDQKEQKARHILISPEDEEGLLQLHGSKYMQSEIAPLIPELVACSTPIAVFGTPCQIAGIRNVLRERQDVVYIDLICHGVPSYHVYQKYRELMKEQYHMDDSSLAVKFRYKPKGWHKKYLYVTDGKREKITSQHKDEYFLLFEQGACYMPACYECRWRASSSADLRVGDFWGKRFQKDETGVSMAVNLTERGVQLLEELKSSDFGKGLMEQPLEDYFIYQQTKNFTVPVYYNELISELEDPDRKLTDIVKKFTVRGEKRKRAIRNVYEVYKKFRKEQ